MKTKLTIFIVLIGFIACQKRKSGEPTATSLKTAQPRGGETTEGGGGSNQLESYLKNNNSDLNETPAAAAPSLYNFPSRFVKNNVEFVLKFYSIAGILNVSQKELQIRQLARIRLGNLITKNTFERKDLIQKAYNLTSDPNVNFIWFQKLEDQFQKPAWSLNSPSKLQIRMNHEMWMGKKGADERYRLCVDILIPYYHQSVFYCYYTVDSIISAHEFLSLVELEKDNDYHISATLL